MSLENDEEIDELSGIRFEPPYFVKDGITWYPEIGPKGNAILVKSKEPMKSHLPTLWELDADQNINEFYDEIFIPYKQQSIGVVLFKGAIENYDPQRVLDIENHLADFAEDCADDMEIFALIDASNVKDIFDFYLLSNPALQDRLHIAWKAPHSECLVNFAWEVGKPSRGWISQNKMEITLSDAFHTALCLPPVFSSNEGKVRKTFYRLQDEGVQFKAVSEEQLALEWCGLETIYVDPQVVSPIGKRHLQGFLAAGGHIIEV